MRHMSIISAIHQHYDPISLKSLQGLGHEIEFIHLNKNEQF